jgi:hypothetical protein
MSTIVEIFSTCGSIVMGCLLIAFAGVINAYAGTGLGLIINTRVFWGSEGAGLVNGLIRGGIAGMLLALYTIFSVGQGAAFLAAIGLAVVMLIIAGLVLLLVDDPRYNHSMGG